MAIETAATTQQSQGVLAKLVLGLAKLLLQLGKLRLAKLVFVTHVCMRV